LRALTPCWLPFARFKRLCSYEPRVTKLDSADNKLDIKRL
jgi:hypothetical protein